MWAAAVVTFTPEKSVEYSKRAKILLRHRTDTKSTRFSQNC